MSNDLGVDLTYLSLGAGVQSTALLVCAVRGLHDVPRPDVALFCDTGCEPQWVYRGLWRIAQWMAEQERPIPIRILSLGHGLLDHPRLEVPPPVFVRNLDGSAGETRRQCTREYKIRPIEREARRLLGVAPGRQVKGKLAAALIGISFDERQRARMSDKPWLVNVYPLVEELLSRDHCRRIIEAEGLPVPGKSSCIVCPYHDDAYWRTLREVEPESWERACQYDERIRHAVSIKNGEAYLHRSLRPLREVPLPEDRQENLWDTPPQVCEGMCGV